MSEARFSGNVCDLFDDTDIHGLTNKISRK